ncbi:GMC oxidoreductase [Rufibacter psychrotolerans]|uniref:GMC oxidoreductase n=1 Tax=Rufibacter psychrotolerans TaxID=2812556 RepID=UPI001966D0A9|nr:GMC family oxidoreductase [Rufibacter sp. SYSU D00308]
MFISQESLTAGQVLSYDLCIIGGGPAAISLALTLAATQKKIILITGGGWRQTKANRDLYKGTVTPPGTHEPPERLRRRQFGGGSAVWAGRCVPFDPLDFKVRPWVENSGWPLTYQEILPYLQKACDFCQIGSFAFWAQDVFPQGQQEIIPGLDSPVFTSACLERWSPPVHFGRDYETALDRAPNVHVLLDAHALPLEMAQADGLVSALPVEVKGKRIRVEAGHFVLAAGGIENARLLLASSNRFFPTGLGNQHDNVGRYYMTHLTGTYAQLNPTRREQVIFGFERDKEGVFCRRRWWMPEQAQQEQQTLNTVFYLSYPKGLAEIQHPLFTPLYGAARQLASLTGMRPTLRQAAQRSGLPPHQWTGLYRLGLPALLPSAQSRYWGLFFQAEQMPNRDSRILLSPTLQDALGMPRVDVRLAFREQDTESLVTAHNLFIGRFRQQGLGEALYSEEGFRTYLKLRLAHYDSYAHQMGTTRMSDAPQTGVVDRNARVHGLANLYVAGASTFATSSHANPTVMVVAQALRLADHLKQQLAAGSSHPQARPGAASAFVVPPLV